MTLKTDPFADLADEVEAEPEDRLAVDLASFAPKAKSGEPAAETAGLTILAREHGFSINNLEEQKRRFRTRGASKAPKTLPITMRVRVADWNLFQVYCEEQDITVAEGFRRLAQAIGLRKGGDEYGYYDVKEDGE